MPAVAIKDGRAEAIFTSPFNLDSYGAFLRAKTLPECGLVYDDVNDTYTITAPARYAPALSGDQVTIEREEFELSEFLFDYQAFIVREAIEAKRYATYADCGLGKTLMFLDWARVVIQMTGGKVLITSPLSVIRQTIKEVKRFYGDSLPILRLNSRAELIAWLTDPDGPRLAITNYDKFIPEKDPDGQKANEVIHELRNLAGLVLDESSILKSGGGTIKWVLIKSARGIEYKLSCTATPAPNDIMEYASQAGFLEKLRTESEILWTFFTRDKEGNWRIKPHAREGFYQFLASWSIYLRDPAAYGWKDNLASIPPPIFFEHRIDPTPEQIAYASEVFTARGSGLFGTSGLGVAQRAKLSQAAKGFLYADKGKTIIPMDSTKPDFVADLAIEEAKAGRKVLIWTVFDEESQILQGKIEARGGFKVARLDGSVKKEADREALLESFAAGELDILISKASMLGFGMNMQHVGAMVFSGWNDSYEQFYQAVRRAYRYGQTKSVHIHIPFVPELEGLVWDNVLRKKDSFDADAAEQERYYREALLARGVL